LLATMRLEGDFKGGDLVGVDYSFQSVSLASKILQDKGIADAKIYQWDLIHDGIGSWGLKGFDIVLDKGTFDAISLSNDTIDGVRICASYAAKVAPLVRNGGWLLITSCNWTEDELKAWIDIPGTGKISQ
jgi:hypothetical protein